MLNPNQQYFISDLVLVDDGTLDTVVRLPDGTEWGYNDTEGYRDVHGVLNFDLWCTEVVLPDMNSDPDLWDWND